MNNTEFILLFVLSFALWYFHRKRTSWDRKISLNTKSNKEIPVDTETLKENLTPPEVHIMNQGMFQRYENEIPTDDFQPGDIWIMPIDPQADGTEQSDMVKIDFVDREKGEIHVKGLSRKPTFDIITFEKIEDMLTDGLVFFKLELE